MEMATTPTSQAGCRRFDPGLPLQCFRHLTNCFPVAASGRYLAFQRVRLKLRLPLADWNLRVALACAPK
jgi:hypothetical protein